MLEGEATLVTDEGETTSAGHDRGLSAGSATAITSSIARSGRASLEIGTRTRRDAHYSDIDMVYREDQRRGYFTQTGGA